MTDKLGRYEILEEIGQGSFAIVYRARVVSQLTAGKSEQTSVAGISQKRPPQKPYLADQAENWSILGRMEGRFDPLTPTVASWGRRKET
jgi:serine/threonine protein kinase